MYKYLHDIERDDCDSIEDEDYDKIGNKSDDNQEEEDIDVDILPADVNPDYNKNSDNNEGEPIENST